MTLHVTPGLHGTRDVFLLNFYSAGGSFQLPLCKTLKSFADDPAAERVSVSVCACTPKRTYRLYAHTPRPPQLHTHTVQVNTSARKRKHNRMKCGRASPALCPTIGMLADTRKHAFWHKHVPLTWLKHHTPLPKCTGNAHDVFSSF